MLSAIAANQPGADISTLKETINNKLSSVSAKNAFTKAIDDANTDGNTILDKTEYQSAIKAIPKDEASLKGANPSVLFAVMYQAASKAGPTPTSVSDSNPPSIEAMIAELQSTAPAATTAPPPPALSALKPSKAEPPVTETALSSTNDSSKIEAIIAKRQPATPASKDNSAAGVSSNPEPLIGSKKEAPPTDYVKKSADWSDYTKARTPESVSLEKLEPIVKANPWFATTGTSNMTAEVLAFYKAADSNGDSVVSKDEFIAEYDRVASTVSSTFGREDAIADPDSDDAKTARVLGMAAAAYLGFLKA